MNFYYIGLSNIKINDIQKHLDFQKKIIEYFKFETDINISKNIRIKYMKQKHIIEEYLKDIDINKDYILWHPIVAFHNLTLLKRYKNSIVVLKQPTVLNQKISEFNPISEEMSVNHNFKIMYLSEFNDDITNINYQVLGFNKDYIFNFKQLNK